MSALTVTRKKRKSLGTAEVDVRAEVDLDDIVDDLVSDGTLHYAEDCPIPEVRGFQGLPEVIGSLHRQAHPSAHPSPWMCNEEPCRSLPMDLVVTPLGRR
jgi:hypothetical protein